MGTLYLKRTDSKPTDSHLVYVSGINNGYPVNPQDWLWQLKNCNFINPRVTYKLSLCTCRVDNYKDVCIDEVLYILNTYKVGKHAKC